MMSEFALAILVVIVVMGSILFCRMYQLDDTQEWLDINEKQFRKHFAGEFVFVKFRSDYKVEFEFYGKGNNYHIVTSVIDAKKIFDKTQGGGIRKLLKEIK